jgi:hypothetical protein
MRWPRNRFPGQCPSTNQLCGPRRGFVSGTNRRPRVYDIKNTNLIPSYHRAGTATQRSPHQTQPDVCPCNGTWPPDHPTQSGGQPAHLSLSPYIDVKRSTRRPNPRKTIYFFLFVTSVSRTWTDFDSLDFDNRWTCVHPWASRVGGDSRRTELLLIDQARGK